MQTLKNPERPLTLFEDPDPSYRFIPPDPFAGFQWSLKGHPKTSKQRYHQAQDPRVKRWKDASQKSSWPMADFAPKKTAWKKFPKKNVSQMVVTKWCIMNPYGRIPCKQSLKKTNPKWNLWNEKVHSYMTFKNDFLGKKVCEAISGDRTIEVSASYIRTKGRDGRCFFGETKRFQRSPRKWSSETNLCCR